MKTVDLKNKSAASMLLFVMERGGVFEKPSRNEVRAQDEFCDRLEEMLGGTPSEQVEEDRGDGKLVKTWKFKYAPSAEGEVCSFEVQEDRWKIAKDAWVKFDKQRFGVTKAFRDARRDVNNAFGVEE